MWNKPCAECCHCIPIGGGEGLCDYLWKIKDKFIVDLFDIEPYCPYRKKMKELKGNLNFWAMVAWKLRKELGRINEKEEKVSPRERE